MAVELETVSLVLNGVTLIGIIKWTRSLSRIEFKINLMWGDYTRRRQIAEAHDDPAA